VLRFPLYGCQYLRLKEYPGTNAPLNRVPIPPCEPHLFAKDERPCQKGWCVAGHEGLKTMMEYMHPDIGRIKAIIDRRK